MQWATDLHSHIHTTLMGNFSAWITSLAILGSQRNAKCINFSSRHLLAFLIRFCSVALSHFRHFSHFGIQKLQCCGGHHLYFHFHSQSAELMNWNFDLWPLWLWWATPNWLLGVISFGFWNFTRILSSLSLLGCSSNSIILSLNTCKPTNLMNILIDLHFYCSYLHKNLLVIICLFYETISIPTVPIYL